jgi:hypothetical protein
MKVRVNDSTDIHTFSLYDEALGEDLIFEFLETHCAFVAEKFVYLEDEDLYACELDIFNKWKNLIDKHKELSARINSLKLEHGERLVDEVISKALFHDVEDEADAINYELDRAFSPS